MDEGDCKTVQNIPWIPIIIAVIVVVFLLLPGILPSF